jgi:hypothetical protein
MHCWARGSTLGGGSDKTSARRPGWPWRLLAGCGATLHRPPVFLPQRGDEQAVALLVDDRSMALADTDEVIHTEKPQRELVTFNW